MIKTSPSEFCDKNFNFLNFVKNEILKIKSLESFTSIISANEDHQGDGDGDDGDDNGDGDGDDGGDDDDYDCDGYEIHRIDVIACDSIILTRFSQF